jgi:hypothetical protein
VSGAASVERAQVQNPGSKSGSSAIDGKAIS